MPKHSDVHAWSSAFGNREHPCPNPNDVRAFENKGHPCPTPKVVHGLLRLRTEGIHAENLMLSMV